MAAYQGIRLFILGLTAYLLLIRNILMIKIICLQEVNEASKNYQSINSSVKILLLYKHSSFSKIAILHLTLLCAGSLSFLDPYVVMLY